MLSKLEAGGVQIVLALRPPDVLDIDNVGIFDPVATALSRSAVYVDGVVRARPIVRGKEVDERTGRSVIV